MNVEYNLDEAIKRVTRKMLNEAFLDEFMSEDHDEEHHKEKHKKHKKEKDEWHSKDNRNKDPKYDDEKATKNKRKNVIHRLDKAIDDDITSYNITRAQMAYGLYPNLPKDSARSKLSQKLNGEKNFKTWEINRLSNMINTET